MVVLQIVAKKPGEGSGDEAMNSGFKLSGFKVSRILG
jgi:hypothetical protein